MPGRGMAAASDRDHEVAGARVADGVRDVVRRQALGDECRAPVDRAVPDRAGLGWWV